MIITLLLNLVVLILGVIFSWLPVVTSLPEIMGYDIDGALVTGVGYMQTFFYTFWPFQIIFQGFLILMVYYTIKIVLKFFLGHRAPGQH